jgi:DNA ligase-associated metallophosphoesterase
MITPQDLKALLMNHRVIPVKFAGHRMLLDAGGVLLWPQQKVLIFSDLHLEKGSFLTQFANPLPRFDSKDTLKRMQLMISRYDCDHIVCLGDSLHDKNALARMQDDDLDQLNTLVASVPKWTWVLGNHDPDIPPEILGERAPFLHISNVLLVHEPEDITHINASLSSAILFADGYTQIDAQIIGHYHPKATYKLANHKVTGKTFVCAETVLLMPAFGKYTGGLDIDDEAFKPIFNRNKVLVYLSYHQKIYLL